MKVMLVLSTVAIVAVVIRSNLINLIVGGSIFGVSSGGGVAIGFGGSFLAHHHHHH